MLSSFRGVYPRYEAGTNPRSEYACLTHSDPCGSEDISKTESGPVRASQLLSL